MGGGVGQDEYRAALKSALAEGQLSDEDDSSPAEEFEKEQERKATETAAAERRRIASLAEARGERDRTGRQELSQQLRQ